MNTNERPPAERPTPETDAFCAQYAHHFPNWLAEQFLAHSRRVERQLAEERESKERILKRAEAIRCELVKAEEQRDRLAEALLGIAAASPAKWDIPKDEFSHDFRPWAQNVAKSSLSAVKGGPQ